MPAPYQQVRRVNVSGFTAESVGDRTDVDMSITVSTKEQGLSFTVELWNIGEDSWSQVQRKDGVRIELGWAETGTTTVCLGRVEKSYAERGLNHGADAKYVLEGVDITAESYAFRYNRTWFDTDPAQIATQINANAGGGDPAIVESVGQPLEGAWTVKNDLPARKHLDDLTKEAENMTGEQWEWDARAGKFYFHPKGTPDGASTLLYASPSDGNLQYARPASGSSTQDGSDEVSFRAYVVPTITKNAPATVQSNQNPSVNGDYIVSSYTFSSSTLTGDHYVEGTLAPGSATYSAPLPGDPTFQQKLLAKRDQLKDDTP